MRLRLQRFCPAPRGRELSSASDWVLGPFVRSKRPRQQPSPDLFPIARHASRVSFHCADLAAFYCDDEICHPSKLTYHFRSARLGGATADKKRARRGLPAAPWLRVELEDELAAEFKVTWILRTGDLAEVVIRLEVVIKAKGGLHAVGLEVVERVERLKAKFDVRTFGN